MIRDLIRSIVSWHQFELFTPLHLLPNKTVVIVFQCMRMGMCMHPHNQMHCDFSFDRCFHELNIYSPRAHTWQLQLAFFFFPFVFTTIPKLVEIATIIIGSSIIIIIIMLHASVLLSPVYFICAKRILILSAVFFSLARLARAFTFNRHTPCKHHAILFIDCCARSHA